MNALDFKLPTEFHEPDHLGIDLDPNKVRTWLSGLPLTNVEKSSLQLLKVLRQLNQARLDPVTRFNHLCLIRPTIENLIELLRSAYQSASLPYSSPVLEKFKLAIELINELTRGFRLITRECTEKQEELAEKHKKLLVTCLYLTIEQLGNILHEHYVAYLPSPKLIWQMTHRTFEYAESMQFEQIPIPSCDHTNRTYTVSYIYKSVLLLSVINPHHLMRGETVLLHKIIADVAGRCPLERLENRAVIRDIYALNYKKDLAPKFIANFEPGNSSAFRLLDINPLINHVEQALKLLINPAEKTEQQSLSLKPVNQPQHSQTSKNKALNLMSRLKRDMLKRILDTLNRHSDRSHPRNHSIGKLEMTIGLSASHFHLSNESCFNPELDEVRIHAGNYRPAANSLTLIPLDFEHWRSDNDKVPQIEVQKSRASIFDEESDALDTWQKIYANHSSHLSDNRNLSELKRHLASTQWKHKNISAGGMCVFCLPSQSLPIRVGELVAYHSSDSESWWIGIVRWLRVHDHSTIEIGLMHIHHCASPIAVRAIKGTGHGGDYFRSLLTETEITDKFNTLIVPSAIYDLGTELVINLGQKLAYVKLTEIMLSTKSISQFRYEIIATPEIELQSISQLKRLLN